jgi:hypothetical protein
MGNENSAMMLEVLASTSSFAAQGEGLEIDGRPNWPVLRWIGSLPDV